MKRSLLVFVAVMLSVCTTHGYAGERYSVGIGFGALYSGIGVNASWFSENNFGYVAAGCVVYRSNSNGSSDSTYGVGAGWLRTDIINSAAANHGVGIYIGPVAGEQTNGDDLETKYGIGATYAYFSNGAGQRGFVFGATPTIKIGGGDSSANLLLNIGYQF